MVYRIIVGLTLKEGATGKDLSDAFQPLRSAHVSFFGGQDKVLDYSLYVADDGKTAIVTEGYSDGDATMGWVESDGYKENLPGILSKADITSLDVLGEPGAARELLEGIPGARFCKAI